MIVICILVLGLAGRALADADAPSGPSPTAGGDLSIGVYEQLGLRSGVVTELAVIGGVGEAITAEVPIAGQLCTLVLHPHSVRAANYRVLVQSADGSYVEAEPGPVRTLRGRVEGIQNSAVAGTLQDDGLHAMIFLPNGEQYRVEPLAAKIADAAPQNYVAYPNDGLIAPEKRCFLADLGHPESAPGSFHMRHAQGGGCGTGLCHAELAIDADFEFFQLWGSVPAVEDRINDLINALNIQYENDVQITHLITAIIIRTFEPDPYDATDPLELLNQFRDEWLENQGDIPRDLALLFTGTNLSAAWIGSVCTDFGFAVTASASDLPLACGTDLAAHALGHLWGAVHCNCIGYTMNPITTCANQFHPTLTIPEIIDWRDSVACLNGGSMCSVDLDGSGNVGAADLAELLGSWGPCPGCPADFDDDDQVGASDLAILLGAWGPCPE